MNNLYSLQYESGGKLYSMQLYGTSLEAETHADNLGCLSVELVEANVEFDFEIDYLSTLN